MEFRAEADTCASRTEGALVLNLIKAARGRGAKHAGFTKKRVAATWEMLQSAIDNANHLSSEKVGCRSRQPVREARVANDGPHEADSSGADGPRLSLRAPHAHLEIVLAEKTERRAGRTSLRQAERRKPLPQAESESQGEMRRRRRRLARRQLPRIARRSFKVTRFQSFKVKTSVVEVSLETLKL